MTVSRNSTDNLNNDGAVHRDTNVWQSNSSRRFGAFVPRIRLHGRLAPPDESLPVADICSSGRVSVRPIRKARISPLSKSLGRPSRKRPAWITKSPQRGDSWTRTASTAFARKPAGNYTYLRITNPPESYTLEPLSLSFSLPSSRSVNPDVFPCPGADFPFDFSSWSSSDTSLSLFRAVCSLVSVFFFFFFFLSREPTLSRITASAMLLCQSSEWRRKTIFYLAGKSRIPFSILWPVRSQRDTMAVVSTRRQKFNR